jgi:autotransporter strand-loop-strand O-heptosyltransferase
MMRFFGTPKFDIHFNNGPTVVSKNKWGAYWVRFLDGDTVVYESWLKPNHWLSAHRSYYTEWVIEISDVFGKVILEESFSLESKSVRINIDSKNLGDTLAWMPQCEEFSKKHPSAMVYVSHFWHELFDHSQYPNLHFIKPEEVVNDVYATYCLGYYFDQIDTAHRTDPRGLSLSDVAADILQLEYQELRPKLNLPAMQQASRKPSKEKYIAIATKSTAECKHWRYPNGWQLLVDWLNEHGYKVMVIQKEPTDLKRVIDKTGDYPISERVQQLHNCEFFIGLGSGLSWLAWACSKPVVLISGFSLPLSEFKRDCFRVINKDVCHGCWNDQSYNFDRSDWYWCPRHRATDRHFECSREISIDMVKQQAVLAIEASAQ